LYFSIAVQYTDAHPLQAREVLMSLHSMRRNNAVANLVSERRATARSNHLWKQVEKPDHKTWQQSFIEDGAASRRRPKQSLSGRYRHSIEPRSTLRFLKNPPSPIPKRENGRFCFCAVPCHAVAQGAPFSIFYFPEKSIDENLRHYAI